MKKIFSIIAASLCGLVVAFIVTLSFVRTNIPISFRDPYQIYVFNQSTTSTVANGYQKKDKEFDEVMKQVKWVRYCYQIWMKEHTLYPFTTAN